MRQAAHATLVWAALVGAAAALPTVALAEGDVFALGPITIPNYTGAGIGVAPDYLGSAAYFTGPAPFLRRTFGQRYIALDGNFASANLLEHPNWRVGPVGVLRLGRQAGRIDDDAVATLPDIGATLELGAFAAWEWVSEDAPRTRWRLGVDAEADVLGEHSGSIASASVRHFFGIGRFAIAGVAIAASWGSGNYTDHYFGVGPGEVLPAFEAEAGLRDVRVQGVFVQPLSPNWSVGGGVQYRRLVGDAAGSPIVADRGSADQWLVGIGAAYTWLGQ